MKLKQCQKCELCELKVTAEKLTFICRETIDLTDKEKSNIILEEIDNNVNDYYKILIKGLGNCRRYLNFEQAYIPPENNRKGFLLTKTLDWDTQYSTDIKDGKIVLNEVFKND